MRDAVRDLLLPLEQQAIARRAADHLNREGSVLTDGQLRQAATLYELAGYPSQAAQLLVRAARAAVRAGGLNAAEQYLNDAQTLTGTMPIAAQEVLVERLMVLTLAGRAGDAYEDGIAALDDGRLQDSRPMIMATARAAVGAGLVTEAAHLLAQLESQAEPTDLDVAVLRAHCALAERRRDALGLGEYAARLASEQNRFDAACEAWVIVGRAARRWGTDSAARAFGEALSLSRTHQLPIWQVSALAELGMLDLASDSDPTRFRQARDLAMSTGMLGVVAFADLWIGGILAMRNGYVAAYRTSPEQTPWPGSCDWSAFMLGPARKWRNVWSTRTANRFPDAQRQSGPRMPTRWSPKPSHSAWPVIRLSGRPAPSGYGPGFKAMTPPQSESWRRRFRASRKIKNLRRCGGCGPSFASSLTQNPQALLRLSARMMWAATTSTVARWPLGTRSSRFVRVNLETIRSPKLNITFGTLLTPGTCSGP